MQIGVIGSHKSAKRKALMLAYNVGKEIAKNNAALVCGGLGGVMEAACRGAKEQGGVTVGILPGSDRNEANVYLDAAIPTGLGHRRNALVVLASDGVIAIQGEVGTLSEMCYCWMYGKPLVALKGSGGYSDIYAGKRFDDKRPYPIESETDPKKAVRRLISLVNKPSPVC